jgi:hypothetical protein
MDWQGSDPKGALYRLMDDKEVPAKDVVKEVAVIAAARNSTSPALADVDWAPVDELLAHAKQEAAAERLAPALLRAIKQARADGIDEERAQEIAQSAVDTAYASN